MPAMARMSSTKVLAACGACPSIAASRPAYSGVVRAADRLDPGLEELAARARIEAEDRPEVRVGGGARAGGGEVLPTHRDRVLRAQAQLAAGRVLRQEQAPPDVLAREVDEHVG